MLATELRSALSDSVRVRGDTAVDFLGLVGVSVVCVVSANVLMLPPDVASAGAAYSSWRATPESGDVLSVFDTAGAGGWRAAVVDSASPPVNGGGCNPSSGLLSTADSIARRPFTRVVLRAPLTPVPLVGAPVRVARPGRYALTRAADGSWSLSYRRCTGSCGVAQPVAGPFAAPSDSGLVFIKMSRRSARDFPAQSGDTDCGRRNGRVARGGSEPWRRRSVNLRAGFVLPFALFALTFIAMLAAC